MLITIFQALLATTFGGLLALPSSFLAAKNLTGRSRLSVWIYYIMRSLFNVLRSIEALLYVAIFVFWVGIGPFAGTMALAVTTFALIGKLFSEAIENIDLGPMEAITAIGANRLQVIAYAILPQIVPPFVSYLIYQWDINIRMATIIGFAGGGGIGLVLSSFFGMLQYHKAGTVVLFIVVVVALMDFASAKLREKLVYDGETTGQGGRYSPLLLPSPFHPLAHSPTLPFSPSLQIVAVSTLHLHHRAVLQRGDAVHDAVEEVAVVRDHQHRAVELLQRRLQHLGRGDVEVVGRLVEQQEIGIREHQPAPAAGGCARRR